MKTIEYTDYEINDLIRTLEYAKDKKMADYKAGKINLSQSTYEIGLIRDLIAKIPDKTFTRKNNIDRVIVKKEDTDNTNIITLI